MASTIQNPQVTQLTTVTQELSALQASGYDLNLLKYPDSVGTQEVPSYITFNIYVPTSSSYQSNTSNSSSASQSQQNSDYLQSTAGKPQQLGGAGGVVAPTTVGVLKTVKAWASGSGGAVAQGLGAGVAAAAIGTVTNDLVSLRPPLRRIAQSVSIYMPDVMTMQMQHNYNTVSATTAMGSLGQASAFGATLAKAFHMNGKGASPGAVWADVKGIFQQLPAAARQMANSSVGIETLGFLSEESGLVGSNFTALALRSVGAAINPQVEMMYQGTQNRTFQFMFRFQPRSPQESQVILGIIQVFKYFSSPAVQPNTFGRYFITPGQFDITFNFGNTVNPFISKLSTSVLTNVLVNYNPNDHWVTMVDGAPPEIELQLQFTEADIIYQNLIATPDGSQYNQGF